MIKRIMVIVCSCVLLISCENARSANSNVEKKDDITINTENVKDYFSRSELFDIANSKILKYDSLVDPIFWNNSMQEGMYINLFNKKDINEVLKFRTFIESLAVLHDNEPIFEYNPVILAINSFPDYLPQLYTKRPDLFLHGHRDDGGNSISPIIYAIRNSSLDTIKFYFEKEINWKESYEMYGSRNAGGSEYFLGGSLLTDSRNEEISNFLLTNGFEKEKNIENKIIYINKDEINVYNNPGFNSEVIGRITSAMKIKGIVITLSKIDDYQWIKFETSEALVGWSPLDLSIGYETGI